MVEESGKKIIFYDSGSCPHAQRTWLALSELGLPYETRKVDLSNKPKEFIDLYHEVYPDPAAPAKVPIIIDTDGFKLVESNITVQYLDEKYGSESTRLLPADPAERAKVLLFTEIFSTKVLPSMWALLRASAPDKLAEAQAAMTAGLEVLDAFLRVHGSDAGGAYFLGGRYSFAELSTSPFVRRMLVVLPHYRGYDAMAVAGVRKLTRLKAWLEASLARPSLKHTTPSDEVVIQSFKKFVAV
ncbi:hypothetical protein WJX81_006244 [Elliptochloris bilobata]|uniref:Glutathione S-transferase n=1 Tax=Elliptochloris bilobata TaxID=381761 RepID=A0AAW1RK06_9CHLO